MSFLNKHCKKECGHCRNYNYIIVKKIAKYIYGNRNKFINQIRAPGGHIQITIMIDTKQQYIKLMRENIYIYQMDSSPICKRHLESMLKGIKSYLCPVQTGHVDIEEFWCRRNIVWNMESDQSFWITSSENQGMMPKRIFSSSCSMQVIQFADLQFHLIK